MGGAIDYESHVRVKHRDTGTWLHLNKGDHVILTHCTCGGGVFSWLHNADLRYFNEDQENAEDGFDAFDEFEETKELFEVSK